MRPSTSSPRACSGDMVVKAIADEKFSFTNNSFNFIVESTRERAKKLFIEAGEKNLPSGDTAANINRLISY